MSNKTDQKLDFILEHIKSKDFSLNKLSRDSGVSRYLIKTAIKKRFPDLYSKTFTGGNVVKIEVELKKNEDPKQTIDFYSDLNYRYVQTFFMQGNKILVFTKRQ